VGRTGDADGADPPRLLHRSSEHGYTSKPALALNREPEAVDESTQHAITQKAHRRERDRQVTAWRETSIVITAALSRFTTSAHVDRRVESTVRVIRRATARLDRELGL
jgi:hypothetical protein